MKEIIKIEVEFIIEYNNKNERRRMIALAKDGVLRYSMGGNGYGLRPKTARLIMINKRG